MPLCNQASFFCRLGHAEHGNLHHDRHISRRFVRGKPYLCAMESWNSFFDKTKLSLSDTFAVNQKEFPVLKFRSILFLSDEHACSNKAYMYYSAGTHFPAENFDCCCEREFCVRRRPMPFDSQ